MKVIILLLLPLFCAGQLIYQVPNPDDENPGGGGGLPPSEQTGTYVAHHRWDADFSMDLNSDTWLNKRDTIVEAYHFAYNLGGTIYDHPDPEKFEVFFPSAITPGRHTDPLDATPETTRYLDTVGINLAGYYVNTISYNNGDTSYAEANRADPYYLSGRNSVVGNRSNPGEWFTGYGTGYDGEPLGQVGIGFRDWTFRNIVNMPITTRWLNTQSWGAEADNPATDTDSLASALRQAITTRGLFRNFTHWNKVSTDFRGDMEVLWPAIQNVLDETGARPYAGGAQSITEYASMRTMLTNFQVSGTGSTRTISLTIDTTGWPYRLIRERIVSVSMDLSGTALNGQPISCTNCAGIYPIASNRVVVDVEFPEGGTTVTSTVGIAANTAQYYATTRPTATSMSVSGSTGTVNCTDCTAVVYTTSTTDETGINGCVYRATAFGNSHSFPYSAGTNYTIGLKDRDGNLNLIPFNPS